MNTTSVNIANVMPVRSRVFSGYAAEMRSTPPSERIRPNTAIEPAEQRVGVVDHRPRRADDDEQAPDDPHREVHLRVRHHHLDDAEREQPEHHEPDAADACRRAGRGRRSARSTGTSPTITSDAPSMNGIACAELRPLTISSAPSASTAALATSPTPPARAATRVGQVADRGDDVDDAHAPRGERDDDERQQHAERVRDDDALPADGVDDVERFVPSATARPTPATIANETATPSAAPIARGDDVVHRALEEERLDEMAASGADRAGDAHLGPALGGEHHEDQEDQEDAGRDREASRTS